MTSHDLVHQVRLAQPDCMGLRRFPTREHQKLDWNGRDKVCREIFSKVSEELRREGGPSRTTPVHIFQLRGQDSFEDAGGVEAFRNQSTRQYMQGRTILLFPRTTAPSPVHVPTSLLRDLDVQVAADYRDPVPELSSTRLRARLTELSHGAHLGAPPEGIHESVWRLALARRLYAPLAPSARRVLIGVLGAPGSGKSTLGRSMSQRLCGVRHLSGGDFHRAACDVLGERYGDGRWLQQHTRHDGPIKDEQSHFVFSCQAEALRQLGTAGFEVVLIDVKDVSQLVILESACLSAFEPVPPPPPSAPPSATRARPMVPVLRPALCSPATRSAPPARPGSAHSPPRRQPLRAPRGA